MVKEVVYKPSIKETQSPVNPDFKIEFNKKFITKSSTSSNSVSNIYTVPEGKTFVLLSCYIGHFVTNNSGGSQSWLKTTNPEAEELVVIQSPTPGSGTIYETQQSYSFGTGFVFPSNTRFYTDFGASGSDAALYCGFAGFEIENSKIKYLF